MMKTSEKCKAGVMRQKKTKLEDSKHEQTIFKDTIDTSPKKVGNLKKEDSRNFSDKISRSAPASDAGLRDEQSDRGEDKMEAKAKETSLCSLYSTSNTIEEPFSQEASTAEINRKTKQKTFKDRRGDFAAMMELRSRAKFKDVSNFQYQGNQAISRFFAWLLKTEYGIKKSKKRQPRNNEKKQNPIDSNLNKRPPTIDLQSTVKPVKTVFDFPLPSDQAIGDMRVDRMLAEIKHEENLKSSHNFEYSWLRSFVVEEFKALTLTTSDLSGAQEAAANKLVDIIGHLFKACGGQAVDPQSLLRSVFEGFQVFGREKTIDRYRGKERFICCNKIVDDCQKTNGDSHTPEGISKDSTTLTEAVLIQLTIDLLAFLSSCITPKISGRPSKGKWKRELDQLGPLLLKSLEVTFHIPLQVLIQSPFIRALRSQQTLSRSGSPLLQSCESVGTDEGKIATIGRPNTKGSQLSTMESTLFSPIDMPAREFDPDDVIKLARLCAESL